MQYSTAQSPKLPSINPQEPPNDVNELDSFGIDRVYRACAAELRSQYLGQYNKYLRQYLDRAHQIAADPSVLGSWDRQIVLAQHHEGKHVRMIYRPILLGNDLEALNDSINLARAELTRRDEMLWQLEGAEFASQNPRPGFVYLVGLSTDLNLYKIGITTDPKRRLKEFDATKLPFEVYFEALIATQDMHGVERGLHQRYAACRVRGEWFALTPEDVEYIKGLAT